MIGLNKKLILTRYEYSASSVSFSFLNSYHFHLSSYLATLIQLQSHPGPIMTVAAGVVILVLVVFLPGLCLLLMVRLL